MFGRRILSWLLAWTLLVSPAVATWSIVVVNTRTGEVAVGVATCLTGTNLRRVVPVIVPGYGAGATQCAGDGSGLLRPIIWQELQHGTPAAEILDLLEAADGAWQTRQVAVVDLQGTAAAWTGNVCGDWQGELQGQSGDLVYSIQGNVLAGAAVITEAEYALVNTPGDLAEKLMAAMEAADAMGGDGRCSCDMFDPASCGTPPPSFSKSAHCGTMLIARPGDPIDLCNHNSCARGDLYMTLNTKERSLADPNATVILRQDYDAWRAALAGRPDAMHSVVHAPADRVTPGDLTPLAYVLDLRDLDGTPLTTGGAAITLAHEPGSAGQASLHAVHDHLDGTYTVEILAGSQPGTDLLRFVVDDGVLPVSLWPPLRLLHEPPAQAPFNGRRPVAGLDTGAVDLAPWMLADGLTAYWLGQSPAGELLVNRAQRPAPGSPFGAATVVGEPAQQGLRLFDLWVSDDELEILACGFESGSPVERLFRSRRGLSTDPWPPFTRVDELDSGFGDGGPCVSPDGLELVFHSGRGGALALWHSRRLDPLGPWQPPTPLTELASGAEQLFPLWLENGTRLVWSERGPAPTLVHADREPDGSWLPRGPLPGAVHEPGHAFLASAYDLVLDELWLAGGADAGAVAIEALKPAYGSLSANASAVSAAAGATVDFGFDAGAAHAGDPYHLLASLSGDAPGFPWNGAVVPLVFDAITLQSIQGANQGGLNAFAGALDAAGMAAPQWVLAPGAIANPNLIGRAFHFAAVAEGTTVFVSNGVALRIDP